MKAITIYSKHNCMQCQFTKKFLEDLNIPFTEVNLSEQPEQAEVVKALGFQTLPVIAAEGQEPFGGFHPDKLNQLAESFGESA